MWISRQCWSEERGRQARGGVTRRREIERKKAHALVRPSERAVAGEWLERRGRARGGVMRRKRPEHARISSCGIMQEI